MHKVFQKILFIFVGSLAYMTAVASSSTLTCEDAIFQIDNQAQGENPSFQLNGFNSAGSRATVITTSGGKGTTSVATVGGSDDGAMSNIGYQSYTAGNCTMKNITFKFATDHDKCALQSDSDWTVASGSTCTVSFSHQSGDVEYVRAIIKDE